jgi:hypothetical protein
MSATAQPTLAPTRRSRLGVVGTLLHLGLVWVLCWLYFEKIPEATAQKGFGSVQIGPPVVDQYLSDLSRAIEQYRWPLIPVGLYLVVKYYRLIAALGSRSRFAAVSWIVCVSLLMGAASAVIVTSIDAANAEYKARFNRPRND